MVLFKILPAAIAPHADFKLRLFRQLYIWQVVWSANHVYHDGELFLPLLSSLLKALPLPPTEQGVAFDAINAKTANFGGFLFHWAL